MLRELRVENLLLIERAELRLAPTLNVLTGETGAGKTVLAHALDLLLGGRARAGIVRPGAGEAYVEGCFDADDVRGLGLAERLAPDAEELVLARRVGSDGRTRAYVNGRSATVAELRDVGAKLVSFFGQHEHRKLTIARAQLELLDRVCGREHAQRLSACEQASDRLRTLRAERERLHELAGAREREGELLEHELCEIDAASPDRGEHEELLAGRERLRRIEALRSAAGTGAEALLGGGPEAAGAVELLADVAARLEGLAGVDEHLDALAEQARASAIEAQDLAAELRAYVEAIDAEAAGGGDLALERVEERLATVDRLMRKHGGSIEAVLEHAAHARARCEELAGAQAEHAHASTRVEELEAELCEHVAALRKGREAAAPRFASAVRAQLSALAMPDARFDVVLSGREPGPSGADSAEFMIAPNPGVPAGPLREIASGGEMSRIMLAIMSADGGGQARAHGALVFDEVDAGISGHVARAVGARLRELAQSRQVLCITHLPQIASLGERHFSIAKDTSVDPTQATVVELGERDVVSELVRMLGGDDGDSGARRHARELRRAA